MGLFKLMETSFDNFDASVKSFLSKTFGNLGLQYSQSQVFGAIFEGIKGVMQNAMFYIEDALNEQNIMTATRKNSIYSLAKISGYEPYYGSAAIGNILVKSKINNGLDSKATKIFIKNYSQIINKQSGYMYTIMLSTDQYSIDITKPLVISQFKIVEGTMRKGSYVAKGDNLESVNIGFIGLIDLQYLKVYVDGILYDRVNNLYDMSENGKEYVLQIGYDGMINVMFGNEVYGTKLEEGQSIYIEYLIHDGEVGNIKSTDISRFTFVTPVVDTFGNEVNPNDYLKIELQNCVSGGTNADSVEFVKNMIGYNSRSNVLATNDNMYLFFKRFSFIGYVNCWSEQNTMQINVCCLRNYKDKIDSVEDFYNLKEDDLLLSSDECEMIVSTLNNSKKIFAGLTLKFIDPIIRKYSFVCYVKPDDLYNKDNIKASIQKSMYEYFLNLKSETTFISKSDIVKTIMNDCEHITSLTLEIISDMAESSYNKGYYDTYEMKLLNGNLEYVTKRIIYESGATPGLDEFGNISLSSKLEIPFLMGQFNYYSDKQTDRSNKDNITVNPLEIYFI